MLLAVIPSDNQKFVDENVDSYFLVARAHFPDR